MKQAIGRRGKLWLTAGILSLVMALAVYLNHQLAPLQVCYRKAQIGMTYAEVALILEQNKADSLVIRRDKWIRDESSTTLNDCLELREPQSYVLPQRTLRLLMDESGRLEDKSLGLPTANEILANWQFHFGKFLP